MQSGRRQSSRFTYCAPNPEFQSSLAKITQYLLDNPIINAILDDDEDRVEQIVEKSPDRDLTRHDQTLQTPLHYAAFMGNPTVCKTLIRSGVQIDPKDQDQFTPLHRACAADRSETVDLLINAGAKVENRNKNWETAWHIAAAHGAVSCLEKLATFIQNANIQDRQGRSALHHASVRGHDQVTEFLLHYGVNISHFDKQERQSIHWAASAGHDQVVRLLINNGAEVNCADKLKFTPIHLAAANGYAQVVETLLQAGASVNVKTHSHETPLHLAARRAQNDVIVLLLKNEAKVNAVNKKSQTPLHYSVMSMSAYTDVDSVTALATSQILLEHGAESSTINYKGQTALHLATKKSLTDHVRLLLKDNHQAVNVCDYQGNSALHYAVQAEFSERIVSELIEHGCDVLKANKRGVTALHLAAQYGCKVTVTRLLQCGAVPTVDNEGRNVLFYASMGGNKNSFEILRELDPDSMTNLNSCSNDGKSLLHIGASHLLAMVQHILALCPTDIIDLKDKYGRTALHLAATNFRFLRFRKQIDTSRVEVNEEELFRQKEKEFELNESRSANCCSVLLNHGASFDISDNFNMTPIHYASASNNNSSLNTLHKVDVGSDPVDLLLLSSLNGCNKTLKTLLKIYPNSLLQKSNQDQNNNGLECNSLYGAAWNNKELVVEILVDEIEHRLMSSKDFKIGDVFSPGPKGKNALHVSSYNGNYKIVSSLTKLAYKLRPKDVLYPDAFGWTPFHYAALQHKNRAADCIEPMVGYADTEEELYNEEPFLLKVIDHRDRLGRTLFHFACISGSSDILTNFCQSLKESEIQERLMVQDVRGKTPLHYAAIYGHVDIISSILTWCPNTFNIHDRENITPFVQSIAAGQVEAFDMMLAHIESDKVKITSEHHGQCFLAAAYNQHTRILNTLNRKFCQNPKLRPIGYKWFSVTSLKGRMPIHMAIIQNDVLCLNTLLGIHSSLYESPLHLELFKMDHTGRNSMHIAVESNSTEMINELLSIDRSKKLMSTGDSRKGNSPLQLAIMLENECLSELIARRCTSDEINHRNFIGETALHLATIQGLGVTNLLIELGGDAFAFDDRGRLPLFAHCETNGGLQALYDLFEHMMKPDNRKKINELLGEEDGHEDTSIYNHSKYVTHLSASDSMDHSSLNGRLSLTSSLHSYRKSLSSSLSNHTTDVKNSRISNHAQGSDDRIGNGSVFVEPEEIDELESY